MAYEQNSGGLRAPVVPDRASVQRLKVAGRIGPHAEVGGMTTGRATTCCAIREWPRWQKEQQCWE